jgi:hypothetical protein
MDELTRFAQRLVEQLGATGDGAHRPIEVTALRDTVLPYRTHRKALGIDTVEDYETVLLRLIAEERGFVKTLPAEAATRCREELAQPNPDLSVLDDLSGATVQITSMAAQITGDGGDAVVADGRSGGRAVEPDAEDKPKTPAKAERPPKKQVQAAPPLEAIAPSELSASSASSAKSASPAVAVACPSCKRSAPAGRQVVFCPWCGERLIPFTCPRCHTELDSAWKHCITCGNPVKDPFSYS